MTEQHTLYWELFIKQMQGSISPEEKADLETWKLQNPESFQGFEGIFQATKASEHMPTFDPKDSWDELQSMIKIDTESTANKTIRLFPWIARVAAAVILVIGITYLFYHFPSNSSESLALQTMVQTDQSDQKVVALPDGTTVWLNRNSELLYPEEFEGGTRTIYLKGEAFFEVTPNKEKPFIIFSGSTKTTVLGTSFNLRAYSKEDEIRLTVVTGKVAFTLADDKEGVIVTPGNMAVLTNNSKLFASGINTDLNFLSWKTNQLAFNGNQLCDLIVQLGRHFDVDITIDDVTTSQCTFTGNFIGTDLENALKIITKATGTTYRFDDGQYTILGKGCN